MGFVISIYEFDKVTNEYNNFPVFNCTSVNIIKEKFKNYKNIALGELLSGELMKIDKEERNIIIEDKLEEILSFEKIDKLFITDIDILFNPNYRLDIIKLFVQLSRNKRFIIQWPGYFSSGYLVYSEPEYEDYKRYEIKEYNLICLN